MKARRSLSIVVAALLALSMLGGCAALKWYRTDFGRITLEPKREGKAVTIEKLGKNWLDYSIHYAGLSVRNPAAIMFDPKDDNRTLAGARWYKVEDEETLSELIGWLQADQQFRPRIWRILGPDPESHFFGYLYYGLNNPVIRVVDENTLALDDLMPPWMRKVKDDND